MKAAMAFENMKYSGCNRFFLDAYYNKNVNTEMKVDKNGWFQNVNF